MHTTFRLLAAGQLAYAQKAPCSTPTNTAIVKIKLQYLLLDNKVTQFARRLSCIWGGRDSNLDRDVDSPYDFGDFTQSAGRVHNSASNMFRSFPYLSILVH